MNLGIGIDTGGTYTDAVIYDFESKKIMSKGKSLTTKSNLEVGIEKALDTLPSELLQQAKILSLSTTLATNACVENKGGRAKLILIGTTQKTLRWIEADKTYGLQYDDVLCIDNDSSFDGKIISHPDWNNIAEKDKLWFSDAQALAVSAKNATRNGGICEKVAKQKLQKKYDVPIVLANDLANNLNVMERGATALLNARLLPIIKEFMKAVKKALQIRNIDINEIIVRSDGSLMPWQLALKQPVNTILSGPAASVIGGMGTAEFKDGLIIDMGGTTTDISVVKDGKPATTDGISIGGYRTQIKGVYIDTFGLGGDSRITIESNKPVLNERRVQPLCVAAVEFPEIKEELIKLIKGKKFSPLPLYEFLYLVKEPENMNDYDKYEEQLIKRLKKKPLMIGSGEFDVYSIKSERLESEGIIMRAGMTATDIMHIKGDFNTFDKEASILGAKYFIRALPQYNDDDNNISEFCDEIYDKVSLKLFENIVRIMLADKYPQIFQAGIDNQMSEIIRNCWYNNNVTDFFNIKFLTKATLVGIGAPIHIFLPKVAQKLGTNCIIPKDADVANALGAIIADVSANDTATVVTDNSGEDTQYVVYSSQGNKIFKDKQRAFDYAKKTVQSNAEQKAREFGALGEVKINIKVDTQTATSKYGTEIELDTIISANATGRV